MKSVLRGFVKDESFHNLIQVLKDIRNNTTKAGIIVIHGTKCSGKSTLIKLMKKLAITTNLVPTEAFKKTSHTSFVYGHEYNYDRDLNIFIDDDDVDLKTLIENFMKYQISVERETIVVGQLFRQQKVISKVGTGIIATENETEPKIELTDWTRRHKKPVIHIHLVNQYDPDFCSDISETANQAYEEFLQFLT